MYNKFGVRLDAAQVDKLKGGLPGGRVCSWISGSVCDLIALDKKTPLTSSFFRGGKINKGSRHVSFYLYSDKVKELSSIIERIKEEDGAFSRSLFVREAIKRKLPLLGNREKARQTPIVFHLSIRINPQAAKVIKNHVKEKTTGGSRLISHWLATACEEFLRESETVDPCSILGTHLMASRKATVAVTQELKSKIKSAVAQLKKANPKFSLSLFINEAARRKLKRERSSLA